MPGCTSLAHTLGSAQVHIRDETGQTALGLVVERQNDELLKLIAGKTISSLNETKLLIAANRAEPDESSPGDGSPDGETLHEKCISQCSTLILYVLFALLSSLS